MTKQTIYYKPQIGRDTKAVLREISTADQNHIKKVMDCYRQLAITDPRPEFGQWFDMPNKDLPKQTAHNNQPNSPRTFCDGIIDKLNQAPHRRDLSPRQCAGIETLSREISEMFDDCPYIVFADKSQQPAVTDTTTYGSLFGR